MKTIDERKEHKQRLKKKQSSDGEIKVKEWCLNDFGSAFWVRVSYSICRVSLIFNPNLKSALSVMRLCESKHVTFKCKCLKTWDI